MGVFFYNLGRLAGPKIRKAKWAYLSATAPESEVVEAERSVGIDMAREMHRRLKPSDDPLKNELLGRIGNSLVRCLKNNHRKFSFECIQAEDPQAFCLPGGFIFLSDSLIDLCGQSADQMAFICAHEMAHIIRGDVMERALSQSLIKAAIQAGHLRAYVSGPVGRLGVEFLNRAYSRENELRADTMSVRLGTAAGYNQVAMIDLFLRLETLQGSTPLSGYFSTHPLFRDRIENIHKIS